MVAVVTLGGYSQGAREGRERIGEYSVLVWGRLCRGAFLPALIGSHLTREKWVMDGI